MKKYYGYAIDNSELENIRNICVLCWGRLGDVLLRVPVIEALKQRFPQASITAVVDPVGKKALENHPEIAEVVVFPRNKKPLMRYLISLIKNAIYLRTRKFDLCVNLYSGGSSPLITRLTGARIRLGFDHSRALRKANNLLVKYPGFCGQWIKALGTKLEPLGVTAKQIRCGSSFYCSAKADAYAKQILPDMDAGYVAMNLGAGEETKCWPVENFVRLADRIHADYGINIVVFTNPGMEQLADEFRRFDTDNKHVVLPKISLDTDGAVLKRCRAIVTGDTSVMHLAFGVKCPSLILFTYTRPEYVVPEDCLYISCFIEDKSNINKCGKPSGSIELSVDFVYEKFSELLSMRKLP
jgi:ADP-heptose:LPS heptosyltransferase